jgi:hypothetical protein
VGPRKERSAGTKVPHCVMQSWVRNRSIKELKVLMSVKGLSWSGLERTDIDNLIIENFPNIEEATEVLSGVPDQETLIRLQRTLSEDRHSVNFTSYQTSDEHKSRISTRPSRMNIPRELWFKHPNYPKQHQMPTYHVHFREEMQSVLSHLLSWYQNTSTRDFTKAYRYFHGSMEGLHGHVQIEEGYFFPKLQSAHPDFDLRFLYQDHQVLHQAEANLKEKLEMVSKKLRQGKDADVTNQEKLSVLRLAVEFDEILINHLGEEEEIVVPLCLM